VKGNQRPHIEEEQIIQWSKETGRKRQQNIIQKSQDELHSNLGGFMCSGMVSNTCLTNGTRRGTAKRDEQYTFDVFLIDNVKL
jgi:hypothetical protein